MISTGQSVVVRACVSTVLAIASFSAGVSFAAESSGAPSTVVARQGNATITLADLDIFAQTIPDEQRSGFFDNPTRLEDLINSLLLKKQLTAEARAIGLDHDPSVMAQMTAASDNALSTARMQKFKADIKVPDLTQLAREEFIGHKEKYMLPEKLEVKHVLISTKSRSKEEAKAIAETVQKDAMAKPGEFDLLIEKYSEDPSKATNHGVMQDAGSDRYVHEFSGAAKELKKVGEISPVVESPFGYHVLKLVGRQAPTVPAFEDVKAKILARLQSDYIEKQVREHTDTLRNLPIEATPELIASLRTRYQDSGRAQGAEPAGSMAVPPK